MSNGRGVAEFRRWLVRVLEQLGWEASAQLEYVHALGVGADELALEFVDVCNVACARAADGSWPDAFLDVLSDVDAHLSEMTRQGAAAWTEQSVQFSPEWAELRSLAHRALAEMSDHRP